ncbi:MAG: hypothetical protein ABI693_11290 [Bryobacteraceae bacterium]
MRDEFIKPITLLSLVRNTAPFLQLGPVPQGRLIDAGAGSMGYREVLAGAEALDGSDAEGD